MTSKTATPVARGSPAPRVQTRAAVNLAHDIGQQTGTSLTSTVNYVRKDPRLDPAFQPILVGEPSVEDTIAILRGLKERYEVHHGVRIQDSALVSAAVLSQRYIADRFLPERRLT